MQTQQNSNHTIARLRKFIQNGGPEVCEYQEMDYLIEDLHSLRKEGQIDDATFASVTREFGEALSNETLQGHAFNKPYGYSGDFEIIERIYNHHTTDKADLVKWDLYWQNHAAARAVRNRREFFIQTLSEQFGNHSGEMLNLACGPCSELAYYYSLHPESQLHVDCLDMDSHAISYARERLDGHLDKVNFINKNIFRFVPEKQYDLIWSAGLFDYFEDRLFVKLIERFKKALKPNGRLIIGNFDHTNTSKPYMELLDWHLNHRSEEHLIGLAREAYPKGHRISVAKEREQINLFLQIQKAA